MESLSPIIGLLTAGDGNLFLRGLARRRYHLADGEKQKRARKYSTNQNMTCNQRTQLLNKSTCRITGYGNRENVSRRSGFLNLDQLKAPSKLKTVRCPFSPIAFLVCVYLLSLHPTSQLW